MTVGVQTKHQHRSAKREGVQKIQQFSWSYLKCQLSLRTGAFNMKLNEYFDSDTSILFGYGNVRLTLFYF